MNRVKYPATSIEEDSPSAAVALSCLSKGYEDETCGVVAGTTIYEDDRFNEEMSQVIGEVPAIGEQVLPVEGETFVGGVYGIDLISGGGRGRTIQYALMREDQDCQINGAYSYNLSTDPPTNACEILLEKIED